MKAKLSLYLSGIMLLAILTVGVGCTKAPNDAQLTSNIQSKLATDSGLQGKQLGVKAEGGTVTLSGTVDNDAEREAAARYASTEPGVKQVINNLTVAAPPPVETAQAPPPAPAPAPAPAPVEEAKPSPAPKPRRHVRERSDAVFFERREPGSGGFNDASPGNGAAGSVNSATTAATEESHYPFRDNPGGAAGRYHRFGNQSAGTDFPCHSGFSAGGRRRGCDSLRL